MAIFIGTLCGLVLVCFGIHWKARPNDDCAQGCGEFKKLQKTYITVYLLATGWQVS